MKDSVTNKHLPKTNKKFGLISTKEPNSVHTLRKNIISILRVMKYFNSGKAVAPLSSEEFQIRMSIQISLSHACLSNSRNNEPHKVSFSFLIHNLPLENKFETTNYTLKNYSNFELDSTFRFLLGFIEIMVLVNESTSKKLFVKRVIGKNMQGYIQSQAACPSWNHNEKLCCVKSKWLQTEFVSIFRHNLQENNKVLFF